MLACLERNLSTVGIYRGAGVETIGKIGVDSVLGVGMTRRVLGPVDRLIGDPVDVAAGLGGTELFEVRVAARILLG